MSAQLEHLLINLSLNSRDAMPDGGVLTFTTGNVELDEAYTAETSRRQKSGGHVMMRVADTGVGMPARRASTHLRAVLFYDESA